MEKEWWEKHLQENESVLDLTSTNLTSLEGVVLPQGLKRLVLSDTKITSLEGAILPYGLQELDLSNTKMASLKGAILPYGLQVLDLSNTSLTSLEGAILPYGLQVLNLSNTKLASLGGMILPYGLQELDLSNTSLTSLEGIILPEELQKLSLRGTGLMNLPESIRHLKKIKLLDLGALILGELPDWLPELNLSISRNPGESGINLCDTNVKGIDMSIFDQPQDMIVRWFEERYKLMEEPLNEIKVAFLGNGGVGKSHTIARLLMDGAEPVNCFDGNSTPGIAITDKTYNIDGEDIRVHFWDFGGQEILYSMHRMFMTERTIYVVMVDARNENRSSQAKVWLDMVRSFAGDAPVLLVVNKLDQNPVATIDERELMSAYPNIQKILHISALTAGRAEFNETFTAAILELIRKSDVPKIKWPKNWKRVKDILQNMHEPYIRSREYEKICRESQVGVGGEQLLNWCNDLGICFCRQDEKLKDYVILRPEWVINAVYTILFNKRNTVRNGMISLEEIFDLLTSAKVRRVMQDILYTWSDMHYILDVVRRFGLSYAVDRDTEFFPMLCAENSSPVATEYAMMADILEFHMEFSYLPNNLLHRLMVERWQELDTQNVWRTGARFYQPDTQLSSVVRIDENILLLYVRSDNLNHSANTYLAILKASIDRIWKQLRLNEPECSIVYKLGEKRAHFQYEELVAAIEDGQTAVYSRAFRRMIPIADILGEEDSQAKQNKNQLIAHVAKACSMLQEDASFLQMNEDGRTRIIRDYLRKQGYILNDQRIRGAARDEIRTGELDLMIGDKNHRQIAACEALVVRGKQDLRIWNEHLTKMLTNYMTSELPMQLLISFVECDVREYHKLWSSYNDHMRKYSPKHGKRMGEYQHVLPLPELPEYLRVAQCTYDIGGTAVTVYHYFVHMGPRDQMDTAVELEQRMRLEKAQTVISMLQSELNQLKVKSAAELSDRNQLKLMLHDSEKKIVTLTAALDQTRDKVETALAKSQQANVKAEKYAAEVEILRSDKDQLSTELLVMQSAIEQNQLMRSKAEHTARVAEEDRKQLEAECQKLLDELRLLHEELAERDARFQKLSMEQDVNRKNDEKASAIEEMIRHLEQKKQELSIVESAAKKAVQTQKQYEELLVELERRKQELQMEKKHAEAAKSARQELERLYSDSKRRQLDALETAEAAQRENVLLAKKLSEHAKQIQSLEEALRYAQSKMTDDAEVDEDEQPEKNEDSALITKEYRVIILGDSEAGKSQILHRLRYPKRNPKKFSGDVTPGIDIASRVFAIDDEHVRVNFWDFGGQEILHSLHRLFLAKNTMYVIVLNTRNDNQDEQAKFWLHYVELYATGAPVVLVLNKIDQNPTAALDMPALRRTFRYEADILDVLRISAREWNQEEFQQGFVDALCDHIKARMNETNSFTEAELRIRDEVRAQNEGKQIVEMEDFKRICKKGNLPEGTNANKLAERFHKAGMLVYFGTRTNMIMDPDWITNIIYRILDSGATRATNGILDHETIEDVLCEDEKLGYRKSQIDFVWKIMQKYGLSFQYQAPVHDLPELEFVPVLCRHDEPTGVTAFISRIDVIQMHMIFRYLPAGVLYQLMVDLKAEMCEDGVWLSGATFENDGCKAVVIREKDRMKFYVHGENRVLALRYLESLRERVEGIARGDMYNATAQETLLGYYIADSGDVEFFDYDRLNLSKEYELNYAMSKIKPGTLVVRDILDQRDGAYIHERDTLLGLVLKGCIDIQKDPKYSANKADENDRNRELARRIEGKFITKDQTQGGLSGSGEGIGELDIEILNDNKMPIAILEALNTTSINTANWRDHLNKLVDNYNTSGLRYLVLTSYVPCKKSKFIDKFKETSEHWKKVEPKGLEGCLESVDTLVMDECPELIRITRADYVRNNFKVSVYHFLVHISGEDDDATADA